MFLKFLTIKIEPNRIKAINGVNGRFLLEFNNIH